MSRAGTIGQRMDEGLRAVNNDIRPLLIEEAKQVVARWKAVDGFIFAMGQAFFVSTKAMEWPWPKHVSLDDTTNNRGPIFGQIPKYAEDFLILAEEYGEQFGYNAFRVNKAGEVIYDW